MFPGGFETRGARGSQGQVFQAKGLEMALDFWRGGPGRGTPRGAGKIVCNAGPQRFVKEFASETPAGRFGACVQRCEAALGKSGEGIAHGGGFLRHRGE